MRDFHFSLDRGGTFTDLFALVPDGKGGTEHRVLKLLSEDPTNYPDAPREGIRRVLEAVTGIPHPRDKPLCTERIASIRMGTTVATNALLERKGERVALAVTAGFPDLLHIGNQSRPHIFDLEIRCPDTLYEQVVEVDELVVLPLGDIPNTRNGRDAVNSCKLYPPGGPVTKAVTGEAVCIRKPPDLDKLRKDLQAVLDAGIRSLAVVLKHAAIFPDHEAAVGELAREMGFTHVSLSSVVMPMVRMVPRGFTAAADAYLTPHIMRYIHTFQSGFDEGLKDVQLLFMQSDGGLSQVDHFSGHKAILSGPAGGYVGYARTTQWDGMPPGQLQVIGFDMGGTSTDVSRYAGSYAHVFETVTAGVNIQAPQLDINTVAAGGGSRLFFRAGAFAVGPESAGAHPGPVAYRKGGYLAITDANLVLGRILPDFFPKIFGPGEDQPLDVEGARAALEALTAEVNAYGSSTNSTTADAIGSATAKSVDEVAMGFVAVANEAMCRPIRALTQMKGFDASAHVLACFGGAGGQHACAIARALGMSTIFVHRYAGILSAVGIRLAEVVAEAQEPCAAALTGADAGMTGSEAEGLEAKLARLEAAAREKLTLQGFADADIHTEHFLNLRYEGTDVAVMTSTSSSSDDAPDATAASASSQPNGTTASSNGGTTTTVNGTAHTGNGGSEGGIASSYASAFMSQYQREFGFTLDRPILVDDLRVRATGRSAPLPATATSSQAPGPLPDPVAVASAYFEMGGRQPTPAYQLSSLSGGHEVPGPAIIIDSISTIVVEPACTAHITPDGNVRIAVGAAATTASSGDVADAASAPADPITLAIFSHRFMGIAEQMGRTLQRTSISVNIKERLDFSCALFGPDGSLVANAPHLPVHLGAMSEAVKFQVRYYSADGPGAKEGLREGDVLMSNHPQLAGGSHLPDITVITPVFRGGEVVFFVASRGHHADIGGISPGSMPPASKVLAEEGAAVVSFKLVQSGQFQEAGVTELLMAPGQLADTIPGCTGTRNLSDNLSDLRAQVAANTRGIQLVGDLIKEYSLPVVQAYMRHIQANAEAAVREMLREFSLAQGLSEVGTVTASDIMDDGSPICLAVTIDRRDGSATFDFAGTGPEVYGNCNAPPAVAYSAIIYSLRCMVRRDIPLNQGCLAPITVTIPPNCLLNPSETAAVVGGNVLTSQRVTDVVLKAFGAAAASQGCMNNFTFGDEGMGYYETVAGGAGAGPHWHGRSGVHTHMTNTRITDPEVFERRYPVVLHGFHLRGGSGGNGKWRGGDGVVREVEFLRPMDAGILSERRAVRPFGVFGGESGQAGLNLLIRANGKVINLGGKATVRLDAGDRIKLLTPGAGGYGTATSGTSVASVKKCSTGEEASGGTALERGDEEAVQQQQQDGAGAGSGSAELPSQQHKKRHAQHQHVHKGSVYEYTARQEGA